jgi:glycosyltransferase involved in cell wall biosynthesis
MLDGWTRNSRHTWTVVGLSAYKWKWRMRHAPLTLADDVQQRVESGEQFDVLFVSDMLSLAEFRGLAPLSVARLPAVAYFHENQLTYPVREARERDYHFAFTNFTTAAAADAVWFNSAFHRHEFLTALREFLARMPDYQPLEVVDSIYMKSAVQPPGIETPPQRGAHKPEPLRILWAARWEHDKGPELFFEALELLAAWQIPFRLSVVGQQFRDLPEVFAVARRRYSGRIDHWGYQANRNDYVAALSSADVIVSTALHEFFGIAVVEAIAAGAYPLLPNRLSYPEILDIAAHPDRAAAFLYDGRAVSLANRLASLAVQLQTTGSVWAADTPALDTLTSRFTWPRRAAEMDAAIDLMAKR